MTWGYRSGVLVLTVCIVILFSLTARAEDKPFVTLLLAEPDGVYQEVADAFVDSAGRQYPVQTKSIDSISTDDLRRLDAGGSLIVPIGVKAAKRVYGLRPSHATVLCLMLPRGYYENLSAAAKLGDRESAVYLDQPFSRSLALARLLLPGIGRVGLLASHETAGKLDLYRQQAAHDNIGLIAETISDSREVPDALQRILPKINATVLLADSNVVNGETVRYILLANYRQQTPVIGFSRGLVNAGAVAAVVSDPSAIAQTGVWLMKQWDSATGSIPAPVYADRFSLVFNYQVARSLGIALPEDGQELGQWRKAIE